MDRSIHRCVGIALLALGCLAPAVADAQDMNIALSRLRVRPDDPQALAGCRSDVEWCGDDTDYRRVMTQFAGSMIPPVLTPAGTRGVRGIYVGFESWITGIDNDPDSPVGDAWFRAAEGDGGGMATSRSRFVDDALVWGRFNVRKGLPFGFELGTNVGYLANTTYWTLGLEVRWALWEGFREDVGWIPDLAVRAAVQTLMGDGEFNVTVPSVDLILSEPFIIANSIEFVPSIMGQVAWVFADSELVDITPGTGAFEECNPDPRTPEEGFGPPPYCRGGGGELNYNVVFPSLRSTRVRAGGGFQLRYEWFTILASFLFDVAKPSELDGDLPEDLPRQWQVDVGLGLTL
ncbi:MAG TPA: hypothetical protein RMH99_28735 [Sandaracinaceae bacterium LLY-WYZ-13_1]|nr:hypothetical protein [Sandaracinaceae bacterium LLY-WYZ-13_1]